MIGIGQTLGNYQIVDKLGQGGMGVVWLAEHPLIGKRVALKVIHRELSQNRDVVTRFWNEARAVNQIGNDHIVDISDFGQTNDGELYFVMELLEGLSLADLIEKERRLPVPRALHIAAQIADALGATHGAAIIHRDLKPENIFLVNKLGDPDFVKVLDFGLAKLVDASNAQGITQKGVILGTPEFMSPEQCESRGVVDHRSDIYALGVLVYQMLTCELPFTGASMGEVLVKQVAHPPPPPRKHNPQIPSSVESIILRCLAKRPEDRFQHMAEVRAALLEPERFAGRASGNFPLVAAPRAAGNAPVAPPTAPTLLEMDVRASGNFPVIPSLPPPPQPPPFAPSPPAASMTQLPTMMRQGGVPDDDVEYAPQRKPRWPWIVLGALLVGGIAAAAVVLSNDSAAEPTAAGVTDTASPSPPSAVPAPARVPAPVPAAVAVPVAVPVPDPGPAVEQLPVDVRIRITTEPTGAEIFDEATGKKLGVSPTDIQLPRASQEHILVFRHPGCGEKRKAIMANADAEIALVLAPEEAAARQKVVSPAPPRPAKKKKWTPDDDAILQPKF